MSDLGTEVSIGVILENVTRVEIFERNGLSNFLDFATSLNKQTTDLLNTSALLFCLPRRPWTVRLARAAQRKTQVFLLSAYLNKRVLKIIDFT